MFKPAPILAAAASALGLATLSIAQENIDDQFIAFSDDRNWYLQRSTCTLAHNANGESRAVVWLRLGAGVSLEFVDPALRDVRQGVSTPLVVAVDGAGEDSVGTGIVEEGRRGYGLLVSDEMLERIATGRRLEVRMRGRALLQRDLAGAGPAIAAMRACYEAVAVADRSDSDMDMNIVDAMENQAETTRNEGAPEAMSAPNMM